MIESIDLDTGVVFHVATRIEIDDEMVDDLDTSDERVLIRNENDLGLGRSFGW